MVDAETIAGIGRVHVGFSEPVDPASASNPGNYQVADKGSPSSVELSPDGRSATLFFGASVAAVQGGAVELPLQASGIADRSPAVNRIIAQTVSVEVERPVVDIAAAHCPEDAREVKIPVLGRAWTLNMFVCPEQPVANRTLIAGFGTLANKIDGTGRYFAKYADGVGFWARNFEVSGDEMITTGEWQMLTASYDGRNLVLYKNGEKMGDSAPELAPDENVLRLGPLDPWDHRRRFLGELREVTAWPKALTPRMVRLLWEASR
jgi:alpha-mannosidase